MRCVGGLLVVAALLGCARPYVAEFRLRDTSAPIASGEVWLVKPPAMLVSSRERRVGVTDAEGRIAMDVSKDESWSIVVLAVGGGGWAGFSEAGEIVSVYAGRDWILNDGAHPSRRSAAAMRSNEMLLGRGSRVEMRIDPRKEPLE